MNDLIWQEMKRVCILATIEGMLAGFRDAAMARLRSDCLLLISEVVAVNVTDFTETTITSRASKTDQEGASESLYIRETTRKVLKRYCAFQ